MIRRSDATSVSSPTNAGSVVGRPSARRYRTVTGRTGAPASTAAWNIAGRNRPEEVPHHVVASGKTTMLRPDRSAPVSSVTVPGSSRSRSRSA